jgi:hypothetical protein
MIHYGAILIEMKIHDGVRGFDRTKSEMRARAK